MKIALRIEYREGVEDPEASTVSKNCEVLGFQDLSKIKIAKEYVFDVNESNPEKRVEELARTLLVNPVIQKYSIHRIRETDH
jgi:phosphoribosylformylglycinamidine synthase